MSSDDAQDDAIQPGPGTADQDELDALHQRMAEIKREQAEEVDRTWTSVWKGEQMMDAKVKSRLSGHEEYQALLHRLREMESPENGE